MVGGGPAGDEEPGGDLAVGQIVTWGGHGTWRSRRRRRCHEGRPRLAREAVEERPHGRSGRRADRLSEWAAAAPSRRAARATSPRPAASAPQPATARTRCQRSARAVVTPAAERRQPQRRLGGHDVAGIVQCLPAGQRLFVPGDGISQSPRAQATTPSKFAAAAASHSSPLARASARAASSRDRALVLAPVDRDAPERAQHPNRAVRLVTVARDCVDGVLRSRDDRRAAAQWL